MADSVAGERVPAAAPAPQTARVRDEDAWRGSSYQDEISGEPIPRHLADAAAEDGVQKGKNQRATKASATGKAEQDGLHDGRWAERPGKAEEHGGRAKASATGKAEEHKA